MAMFPRKHFQNLMLGIVRVLIFVYEDVSEASGILFPHLFVAVEEHEGVEEHVVEVHGLGCPAAFPVCAVYLPRLADEVLLIVVRQALRLPVLLRQQQAVFGLRNPCRHRPCLVDALVKTHFLDDSFDDALLVVRIAHRKVAPKA